MLLWLRVILLWCRLVVKITVASVLLGRLRWFLPGLLLLGRLLPVDLLCWLWLATVILLCRFLSVGYSVLPVFCLPEACLSVVVNRCILRFANSCWCSNNVRGPCSVYCCPVYIWAVNIHGVAANLCLARAGAAGELINRYTLVCYLFYCRFPWPVVVPYMACVISIYVVNNGSVVNVFMVLATVAPIIVVVMAIEILWPHKHPPTVRAAIVFAYVSSWPEWSPSAISVTKAPANPCRCPIVTGNP